MKVAIYIELVLITLILSACADKHKSYIYWQEDNLCIVMPHPTIGIVGVNVVDWRGVKLGDVIDGIYYELKNSSRLGNITIVVRFEISEHDKYGNETISYDDHFLTTISISEAKKYKSGNFLDMEYGLSNLIKMQHFQQLIVHLRQ